MTHTPGPWRVGLAGLGCVVADSDTGADDHENVAYYGGHLVAESVGWEANRRLIAAAPDLLAAAEALLAADLSVQNNETLTAPQWDEVIDALDAAVKKARGEP